MSTKHPIVAVTGSSGAGTTSIQHAFSAIFRRLELDAVMVHGDSYFRHNRADLAKKMSDAAAAGKPISHFGPDANLFADLQQLFRDYSATGTGRMRHYARDQEESARHNVPEGEFTPWSPLPADTDLLFYEGLHGGVVASTWTRRRSSPAHLAPPTVERRHGEAGFDVAQYVDLLIGVVPVINLEWIQKIHRDCRSFGCTVESVTSTILRRMNDYINFIVPQFSVSDINFQRVPLVDTSNPFEEREIPLADESVVVIHFRDPKRHDFIAMMDKIDNAFMSRPNTMVVPGGKLAHAIEVVCTPILRSLIHKIE